MMASGLTGGAARLERLVAKVPLSYACAAVFIFALIVNMAFAFGLGIRDSLAFLEQDELEYLSIAKSLLDGSYDLMAGTNTRRTIVFPAFLAVLLKLFGGIYGAQIAISVVNALSAPLLVLIVERLSNARLPALLAGLALACWPPAVFFGNSLYSESLALPAFLLALCLCPTGNSNKDARLWQFAVSGLVLGITVHIRPMYLLFIPFLLAIIIVEHWRSRGVLARCMACLLGFALAMAPWSIYASIRHGEFVLISQNSGETIAGGLNPVLLDKTARFNFQSPRADAWIGPGKWINMDDTGYLSEADKKLSFGEKNRLVEQRTYEWIRANPGDAAYLQLRKLAYMWGIYPLNPGSMTQFLFGTVPILALLVLSVGLALRQPLQLLRLVRLAALPVFVCAVALVSWGSWRYRIPGDAGLLAFCAVALYETLSRQTSAKAESLPASAQELPL